MKWQIWQEGFCATGESGSAEYIGEADGLTFQEAALNMAAEKAKSDPTFDTYFDPIRLSYWGCRWFDNEPEARASFG